MSKSIKPIKASAPSFSLSAARSDVHLAKSTARAFMQWFGLPFDVAREQYAKSVRAGLVERSLIASARFEHAISALERFTLGGMARSY